MQEGELGALAAQMAEMMVRFEHLCQSIEQQQTAFVNQLPALFQGKMDGVMQTLSGQADVERTRHGHGVSSGLGTCLRALG